MARQAREISKSGNYYVVLRGQELFVTDEDKARFAEIANEKFAGGSVYGIEITKTEIRMAVKEPANGISMAMKSLTTVYARYFNNANGREGKLFEGRFKSAPLESKKEVDDCVSGLKMGIAPARTEKKPPAQKAAPKRNTAPKTAKKPEKKAEPETKSQPKKNLPSWLL